MRFRKRPVVVDAVKVSKVLCLAETHWEGIPEWVVAAYQEGELVIERDQLIVVTMEGRMTATDSDWLIRGVQGELYPCKDAIFMQTYDEVQGP